PDPTRLPLAAERAPVAPATAPGAPEGRPESANGTPGLYYKWQQIYADAQLPDGSGVDWAKLDQLQNDFRAGHSDAEMTALQAYQAEQEKNYPALSMYRAVMDNHRAQQRRWARQLGMTDSQLTAMLRAYGDLSGDRRAQALFIAQHPQMAAYE